MSTHFCESIHPFQSIRFLNPSKISPSNIFTYTLIDKQTVKRGREYMMTHTDLSNCPPALGNFFGKARDQFVSANQMTFSESS
jgi:hypothetical protein